MTLGQAGVAGDGPDTFNQPSGVIVAPNGDIFVADGHGGEFQRASREVHPRWEVHQGVGKARVGTGRVQCAALPRV